MAVDFETTLFVEEHFNLSTARYPRNARRLSAVLPEGSGVLASPVGYVRHEDAPVVADIAVVVRSTTHPELDGMVVRRLSSSVLGAWDLSDLSLSLRYDVIGRYGAQDDIIVSNITPVHVPGAVLARLVLPNGREGVAFSGQVYGTGGSGFYTFTKQAGPAWMSVNSSTGAITGTPDIGGTGITVTVRATDIEGNYGDATDTLDVIHVPTDPLFANVTALLNFPGTDGSTTFSDATGRTWTANGNAQIDTSLGYNTGLFDGGGDNVTTPYVTADFDWWTTDFTIEAWIYIVSAGAWSYNPGIDAPAMVGCASTSSVTNYWSFGPLGDGTVGFYYYNGSPQSVTNSTAVSTGALQHIAMSKTSSGIYIASHGTVSGPTAVSGTPQSSTSGVSMTLGQINNTSINGHVRALRVTKGVARYTSNFTPPTAPFPEQ